MWVAFDHDCETKLFAAMPMSDVIADVLKDSEPMRPAELVVALQDLGCRAEDDPQKVVRAVRKALQGIRGGFRTMGVAIASPLLSV